MIKYNKGFLTYKADPLGTEELLPSSSSTVITCSPLLSIRYSGNTLLEDLLFYDARQTSGGVVSNINNSDATVEDIKGNTIIWNLMCGTDYANYSKMSNTTVTTATLNDESVYKLTRVKKASIGSCVWFSFSVSTTRRYYISARVAYGTAACNFGFHSSSHTVSGNTIIGSGNNTTLTKISEIVSPKDNSHKLHLRCGSASTAANTYCYFKDVMCIDLTTMFGTDTQIASALGITTSDITTATGAAVFETWLTKNIGKLNYYNYSTVTLIPVLTTEIRSTINNYENICNISIISLTGKLNGEGNSVTIFPDGMKRINNVYDEIIKQLNNSFKAIKRIGSRAYDSELDSSAYTDGTITYYELATPEEYIIDLPAPKELLLRFINILPSLYLLLEYLETNGTLWINTYIKCLSSIKIECKISLTGDSHIFGARELSFDTTGKKVYSFFAKSSNTTIRHDWLGNSKNFSTYTSDPFILKAYGGTIDIDGNVSSRNLAKLDLNKNFYIGRVNGYTSSNYSYSLAKYYYFKLWYDNTLVRNFIPAKRISDDELGMYDTVTGTFFTNSGTGTFIAGPTVSNVKEVVQVYVGANKIWEKPLNNS